MTPHEFIAKWKSVDLSERSACLEHFLDPRDLLGRVESDGRSPGNGLVHVREKSEQTRGMEWRAELLGANPLRLIGRVDPWKLLVFEGSKRDGP
jgi:hypothetical protein